MMQDHCVGVLFQVFNHIWRRAPAFATAPAVPHCYCYEVFPTGLQEGFIEAVANITPLGEFKWLEWYQAHHGDAESRAVTNMIYTAAGAYAGGYVLGATDRHWDNIVVKDEATLFHIDFSFIFGEGPPIDAPRISIPPEMEKLLRAIGRDGASLWDVFVETTVDAFLALRREQATVVRAAGLMFGKAGFDGEAVRRYLRGKSGLHVESSEEAAGEYVRRKILGSSKHWKARVKQFVHDVVNPAWYGFVQAGPLPADGVMRLINRYQAESRATQRLAAKAEQARLEAGARVDID